MKTREPSPASCSAKLRDQDYRQKRRESLDQSSKWGTWLRWTLIVLVSLVLALVALVQAKTYPADGKGLAAWQALETYQIKEGQGWTYYVPAEETSRPSVVFLPGGLVSYKAYSPLAEDLLQAGYPVVVVKPWLNLPILDSQAATRLVDQLDLKQVVLVGHSLGGVVAAGQAAALEDQGRLAGLVLLASYPSSGTDLSDLQAPVLSLTGDQDRVLNWITYEEAKDRLPATTSYVSIEGGNHSGFGSYGLQKGDGVASLSQADQRAAVVEAVGGVVKP